MHRAFDTLARMCLSLSLVSFMFLLLSVGGCGGTRPVDPVSDECRGGCVNKGADAKGTNGADCGEKANTAVDGKCKKNDQQQCDLRPLMSNCACRGANGHTWCYCGVQ